MERRGNTINLRGMELPLVDAYKMTGKAQEKPVYVITQTPWASQNKTYAVAAEVKCIHLSPVGRNMESPPPIPLVDYIRECWENEDGEPFFFMDWTKMVD
jgi:chemotaxis signal transduction protein